MENRDLFFMEIAIQAATTGLGNGNFPVGATLVINDIVVDSIYNKNKEWQTLYAHAENLLLINNSAILRAEQKKGSLIELFTTLEPCMYCFGGIVQHNIRRLVYSVSDPIVGSCSLLSNTTDWYLAKNIEIVKGIGKMQYLPLLKRHNDLSNKYDWKILLHHNDIPTDE